jgi:glycosyltransferase involved in cell wall biosynthesis
MALDTLLPLYREFDIFVLPTLPGEGIPRVLLEAMSKGLPVVTTNVAGIPSLITHDLNGVLVEPTADALSRAVRRIVSDHVFRRALIQRGYETATTFTLEAQAARLLTEVSQALRLDLRTPAPSPAG